MSVRRFYILWAVFYVLIVTVQVGVLAGLGSAVQVLSIYMWVRLAHTIKKIAYS